MPGYSNWYDIQFTTHDSHNEFELSLNSPAVFEFPFQVAANYTAKKIAEQHKNIYVALSGGLDSEFVASVFLRNGIAFTPVVIATNAGNDHFYALQWCADNQITPMIVNINRDDIDYVKFCHARMRQLRITSVSNLMVCYAAQRVADLGGTLVTGDPTIPRLTTEFDEAIGDVFKTYWFEFLLGIVYPGQHVGGFFFYTPEMARSYAEHVDTSLNDARARTRLYETVPYRPKFFPPYTPLSNDTASRLNNLVRPLDTREINCQWTKENFIALLTNLNKDV